MFIMYLRVPCSYMCDNEILEQGFETGKIKTDNWKPRFFVKNDPLYTENYRTVYVKIQYEFTMYN